MNHYQSLSVLQSAEDAVIKAAYKALASLYHPDKNKNPDASSKMQKINEAYEVLSDKQRRTEYDILLNSQSNEMDSEEFESTNPFSEDPLIESWEIVMRFHPEINGYWKQLEKLSWKLAFSYKISIIESQNFKNAEIIARKMRFDYLSKYFGENKDILNYAALFIVAKQLEAARYLNKVVVTMGKNLTLDQIRSEMREKFPEVIKEINGSIWWKTILSEYYSGSITTSIDSATNLFVMHGGSVNIKLFGQVETYMLGNKIVHNSKKEFCTYVLDYYREKYT